MALAPVSLQPKFVFGLRLDIKGNVHFLESQEIIYPVAGVIAIHDHKHHKQKFFRLSSKSVPTVIAISPNRKTLAISEWIESSKLCLINTYDVGTLKKKKSFKFPKDVPTQNVESLRFTEDSRGLAVLSREPDAFLVIFYFDKSETIIFGRVSNGNQPGMTTDVLACNLNDTGLVAVGGKFTFKLLSRQDKSFGMIGTMSGEHKIITSLVWLTAEILVAGTCANQLLFIEGGDPKQNFEANAVQIIDLEKAKDVDSDQPPLQLNSVSIRSHETDVNCLTNFESGFCYSQFNQLFVFVKEKSYVRFTRRSIIKIPIDLYPPETYTIKNVSVNLEMDTVVVSTLHSQIYISKLMEPETVVLQYLDFAMLGEPLHIGGIIGMSICSWKSIIMTAAKDQTVRIWNYETLKVELVKKYKFDIYSIALHPTGLFVSIGFSDQLHLMEILLNTLKTAKSFPFPGCNEAVFSHQGHLLACAYNNLVTIVSVFSFEIVRSFKGHCGNVLSIVWSNDDTFLVTSGNEGAIYQWNVSNGERLNEIVEKGIEFRALGLSHENTIYACTNSGFFREIQETDVIREIDPDNGNSLTRIAVARSNLMLFIGSESGNLINVQVPFLEAGGGTCTNYRFFSKAISCMKTTFDDRLLLAGSEDGTLVIWIIVNHEGKTAPVDSEHGKCSDIIVSRSDLIEKIKKIETLETRLNQLSTEHSFELEHIQKIHSIALQKTCESFTKTINDLKKKKNLLEETSREEMLLIKAAIQEENTNHSKGLIELEAKLCEKILIESNKSAELKTKLAQSKEEYEKLLRKSADCLRETTNTLEKRFNQKLKDRDYQIRTLMGEIQNKKEEFFHYCNQLNLDHDRKMAQLSLKYETQLKETNDELLKWRTEVNILTKKIDGISSSYIQFKNNDALLTEENNKNKKYICQLEQNLNELHREIELRNRLIDDKETCLKEAIEKNAASEKLKNLFNERAIELEAQIQPLNEKINENNHKIMLMRKSEIELNQKIETLTVQIGGHKDRYKAILNDLKLERTKTFKYENKLNRMYSDLHEIVENIQNVNKLKDLTLNMFVNYVNGKWKPRPKEDVNVKNAAKRRKQLTKSKAKHQSAATVNEESEKLKLIKQNLFLISEINRLKESNEKL